MLVKSKQFLAALALSTTCLLWASAFVFIRKTVTVYTPADLALLRYAIASIVMLGLYFLRTHHNTVKLADLPKLMIMGFLGITIYNLALNTGETQVPSATACFIISQIPIISSLLAWLFLKEHLTRRNLLGLVISFSGVLLIAVAGFTQLGQGRSVLLVLLSALCASIFSVMQKPMLKRIDPFQLVAWSIWIGTSLLLWWAPSTWHQLQTAPLAMTWDVVFIGVFPAAIAYALWSYGIAHMPINYVVRFLYAMPLLALIMAWIMLGELPKLWSLVGGLIAVSGAILAGQKKPSIKAIKNN